MSSTDIYIYIYIYIYKIYNSFGVTPPRLYNLQILQTDIWEGKFIQKKRRKTHVLLENNQAACMSHQKKKH